MVRVGLNKNGSIHTPKESKPKLDDAMMRMKRKKKHMIADMKHKKHHRKDKQKDKDKEKKQKMLERKMLEQKMMELEKEHMDDNSSDSEDDETMSDVDSFDAFAKWVTAFIITAVT